MSSSNKNPNKELDKKSKSRHILFDEEQYELLEDEARRMRIPIVTLIKLYVAEGLDRANDRLIKQSRVKKYKERV